MTRPPLLALLLVPSLMLPSAVLAQSAADMEATVLAEGLSHPWAVAFLPDGAAIVTERTGTMRLLVGKTLSDPIEGVPEVAARGQGGLLDVAVSPSFDRDSLIFFTFSEAGDGGVGTAVGRGKLVRDGASARLEDVRTIFSMAKKSGTTRHFGSRLVFAPDGALFVSTGDRGEDMRAQDMQDHAGAVLRIDADGKALADNPYAGGGALPEIWSKGHRNIQAMAYDRAADRLVAVEHGAKGGDEVNLPEAGKNYGWPVISYGVHYSGAKIGEGTEAPGYEQPVHYWDPSIAPSGLAVYRGGMFPEWDGDLLVGSLKFEHLARLDRDETGRIVGEERLLEGEFGRIRDVRVAPDGAVWLVTDESNGKIVRLSRAD
jgi:glucose/arabinose dehydrogenase